MAKAEHNRLSDEAHAGIVQLREEMKLAKQKSDDDAAKVISEAEAIRADAKAQRDAIAPQLAAAKKAEADAVKAKKEHEAAVQAAQEMQKSYQQKVAQLQAVLA